METAHIEHYNKSHLSKKDTPKHHKAVKQKISTPFRPLIQIADYEAQFIDPRYEQDPCWNDDLYDQDKLEYKQDFNKPPEKIVDDDIITDSHLSNKLICALVD